MGPSRHEGSHINLYLKYYIDNTKLYLLKSIFSCQSFFQDPLTVLLFDLVQTFVLFFLLISFFRSLFNKCFIFLWSFLANLVLGCFLQIWTLGWRLFMQGFCIIEVSSGSGASLILTNFFRGVVQSSSLVEASLQGIIIIRESSVATWDKRTRHQHYDNHSGALQWSEI